MMNMRTIEKTQVTALTKKYQADIQHKIDQKTKPVGSLGQLENVALQLAVIQSHKQGELVSTIKVSKPTAVVFAGDHGIAEEGVSIAPSCVTRQMVQNFLAGGAAINCFCETNQIDFKVVDAGIIEPLTDKEITNPDAFINMRLGAGTKNIALEPAMTSEQVNLGLLNGEKVVTPLIHNGTNVIILGEMGIGNTSSATAILAKLTHSNVKDCVGVGTGISTEQLHKKTRLIEQAVNRCKSQEPIEVLQELGGFEIVQMTGAIIAAASAGITILVDGFIVSVAALAACKIQPNVGDFLIFSHESQEFGHQLLLNHLNAKPLLNLGLRLGEGTGAALALPLLKASANFYNKMASFEDAGVTV